MEDFEYSVEGPRQFQRVLFNAAAHRHRVRTYDESSYSACLTLGFSKHYMVVASRQRTELGCSIVARSQRQQQKDKTPFLFPKH
jgi:hypothetical protein